jgi:tetratricopeptide (TPR) repeat protein
MASLSGVAVAWHLLASVAAAPAESAAAALEEALQALDRGNYIEAQHLAAELHERKDLPVEDLGGPLFVLGAVAAYEAGETWSKDRAARYLLAVRYLEEARNRGFPPGRRADGLFLLAKSLYGAGRIPASRPALQEALKLNPGRSAEIHYLMAGAYLDDAAPKLEEALAENSRMLADPKLRPELRNEGLLQRAQILLRMGKPADAADVLGQIRKDARNRGEAIVLLGQVLLEEARALKNRPEPTAAELLAAREKYLEAIRTLRLAQTRDTLSNQATRKSLYLIGVCMSELGDQRAALGQFERTRKLFPDTPEGFAAGFEEAQLARELGRDADALAGYRRTLEAVTDPENYSNPWLPLDRLRREMLAVYQHYLETQNFEATLGLTRLFFPLFPRTRALELTAEVHQTWGRTLLAQAEMAPAERREALRQAARANFRQAGRVHRQLADLLLPTRRYPDQLWQSATAYFEGQNYRAAIALLEKYLQDRARERHPQSLVLLGQAHLAQGEVDKALEAFRECVEFHPRDAAAYRARLLASRACVEKGDLREAEALLRENLSGEHLTPASREWRDSLFALGELLHAEGAYEDAVARLEEAVERYPDDPAADQARYLAAESHRRWAAQLQDKLRKDLLGAARAAQTREIQDLYAKSLDGFRGLQAALLKRHETEELTDLERALLRNCYFAVGSVLVETGQYEAAVKAYAAAANRYQNAPEVLQAYVRMAEACRRLGRPAEARSILEQAKVVLGRMKPESDFREATNYSREDWSALLESLTGT